MVDVLTESQTFWDAHAARDPLWAVLSDAGKEGRRWDIRRFLLTGVNELAMVFYELESHAIPVTRGSALDFGCGVGRLTQALAPRFEKVVGVDVSPRMIETAISLNQFPERASFALNAKPDLRMFGDGTFDFIYTNLVLQHIDPALSHTYLGEFLRLLKPGGVLVFQLPSHQRPPAEPAPAPAATPMPDEAYRAVISIQGLPRGGIRAGAPFTLETGVTNVSRVPWSLQGFGAITIGNHWLDRTGERMLRRDDGRTPLPHTLAPGSTCWIPLTINAPEAEGDYQCEFDLAHEGIRWFEDRGSEVMRVPIHVRGDAPEDSASAADDVRNLTPASRATQSASAELPSSAPGDLTVADPGDFPMNGIHTNEIARLMAAGRAEILLRHDDPSCGPDWVSYRYFVRAVSLEP